MIRELINFPFKGGGKEFIPINKFRARLTDNQKKFKITSDKSSLKLAINFLLNNCFFNFGNLFFQQITGTSMGSDPATFIVNLFLYYYENKWLLETTKRDLCKARCFIDYLCAKNNQEL